MIVDAELYDLRWIITLIRQDPEPKIYIHYLKKVIDAINNGKEAIQPNNIRNSLSSIVDPNDLVWGFVFIENFETRPAKIIKKPMITGFLVELLNNIVELLSESNHKQAFSLLDLSQALVQILAEYNGMITKSFWKHGIIKYCKEWNSTFLLKYKKDLLG